MVNSIEYSFNKFINEILDPENLKKDYEFDIDLPVSKRASVRLTPRSYKIRKTKDELDRDIPVYGIYALKKDIVKKGIDYLLYKKKKGTKFRVYDVEMLSYDATGNYWCAYGTWNLDESVLLDNDNEESFIDDTFSEYFELIEKTLTVDDFDYDIILMVYNEIDRSDVIECYKHLRDTNLKDGWMVN